VADDDVWGVYWPGDDGASVPDVHAAEDCPQPLQLGAFRIVDSFTRAAAARRA
jgi:hypothetical protein